MKRMIRAVDMFAGAGGTSTGLKRACDEMGYSLDLLAINHWDIAILTHTANHPYAAHICETFDAIDPKKVRAGGLDILVASPECTHHLARAQGFPDSYEFTGNKEDVVKQIGNAVPTNLSQALCTAVLG